MQALDHRAFLRGHEAGAERARDAERVLDLFGGELSMRAAVPRADEDAGVPCGWKPLMKSSMVAALPMRMPIS